MFRLFNFVVIWHSLIMDKTTSAYDSLPDYDVLISEYYRQNPGILTILETLLSKNKGQCLDVGCGTGVLSSSLTDLGLKVTGLDISQEQLAIALQKKRLAAIIQADAAQIPLSDNAVGLVISTYTHTDFDNWVAVVREIYRVLKPNGKFIYIGPHPCFFGGHIKRTRDKKSEIYPGYYRNDDRIFAAPGFSHEGLREKVGEKHLTLQSLLNSFLEARFKVRTVIEEEQNDPPIALGIAALKLPT